LSHGVRELAPQLHPSSLLRTRTKKRILGSFIGDTENRTVFGRLERPERFGIPPQIRSLGSTIEIIEVRSHKPAAALEIPGIFEPSADARSHKENCRLAEMAATVPRPIDDDEN
jgi:hypothetical protein